MQVDMRDVLAATAAIDRAVFFDQRIHLPEAVADAPHRTYPTQVLGWEMVAPDGTSVRQMAPNAAERLQGNGAAFFCR